MDDATLQAFARLNVHELVLEVMMANWIASMPEKDGDRLFDDFTGRFQTAWVVLAPSEWQLKDVDLDAIGQGVGDEAIAMRTNLHLRQLCLLDREARVEPHDRMQVDPRDRRLPFAVLAKMGHSVIMEARDWPVRLGCQSQKGHHVAR